MLFRIEAIDHHRSSVCGEMTLPVAFPVTVTTAFLAASLALFLGFLGTGSFTRKQHVSGFLVPRLGVVRILPPRAGTITGVRVQEGQKVQPGTPLLALSTDQSDAQGQAVDAEMLRDLHRQADQIRAQLLIEQQRVTAARASAEESARTLEQQLATLRSDMALQTQRTAIALRDVKAAAGLLAREEMSPLEGRRRQDAYLAQRQAEGALSRAILDKQAEFLRARRDIEDSGPASAQRMAVLQGSAADLESRIAGLEGQRATLLTAPVGGHVSALQAWVGRSVDPSMPLLSIVPDGDALQAQLLVPARAIGFVRPGQPVRLSYDAFPYQRYGFADGTVEALSRTLLKPGELAGPISTEVAAFRVTVTLARQSIRVAGAELPLQTDTPLQADILLDRRSLLAWIADPLRAAGRL
jgi:membrane fusion protein